MMTCSTFMAPIFALRVKILQSISVDLTISDRPSVNGDTLSRHMAAIVVATSNVCLFTLQKNLLHLLDCCSSQFD